jgi:hypothetical protein
VRRTGVILAGGKNSHPLDRVEATILRRSCVASRPF